MREQPAKMDGPGKAVVGCIAGRGTALNTELRS